MFTEFRYLMDYNLKSNILLDLLMLKNSIQKGGFSISNQENNFRFRASSSIPLKHDGALSDFYVTQIELLFVYRLK